MAAGPETIAVVRCSDHLAEEILGFLTTAGKLNEAAARRLLAEAVSVAVEDDQVVGINSVRAADVQLIGGRRFWIYQSVFIRESAELWDRMFNAAFEALAAEFEGAEDGCVGVCAMVDDPLVAGRPGAVWPDTDLMFAGFLDDGRQVRIRYFWDAVIGPGLPGSPPVDVTRHHEYPLDERYRVEPIAESGDVTTADVLQLWAREGAIVDEGEVNRRVHEVQLVAVERDAGLVGVSSLYLQRNPQLGIDLWYYRTFVAAAHRNSNLAAQLIFGNRDLMEERFVRGEDTRGQGMIFELQNEGMRKYFNRALWLPADFTFIGENARGDHVRVHYFPGAQVPATSPAATG